MAPSERCARARASAVLTALAGVVLGCTELAPGTDLLSEQPGALAAGTATSQRDPKWGCLTAPEPASAVALRPFVVFSLRLYDPTTQATPPATSVRACNRFDIGCANPVAGPTAPAEDGLIYLQLPQDFDGFLEITSPAIVPALYYFNPPLQVDRQDEFIVVSFATASGLAGSGNVQLDPELGMVAVRTMDCQGELTGGVEFSNNVGGVPFAFIDGLPVIGFVVSDPAGIGGFVNVPPGTVVLQGQETSSGQISSTATVLVRRGWFAYGDLNPAPR